MKNKKWLYITIAVVLLLLAAAAGYKFFAQTEVPAAAVEVTEVEKRNLRSTVSATGTIRPMDSVEVSSKVTARIQKVLVKENDVVSAGQTVALLEGKDYEAKRDQAAYKLNNAYSRYKRMLYLYETGAVSQQDLDDATMEYNTAQSTLDQTESDLNEMVILAPIDGVVVGEPKSAGTMAVQGNSNPTVIMTIADLSKKQILAKVDETDIGAVKIGQTATFTVDSYTDRTFKAKVSSIAQTDITNSWNTRSVNSTSNSSSVIYYYVVLDVDDEYGVLLPAMTARVEINTAERNNVLTVPISALKSDTDGSYVMLSLPDGNSEKRYVVTGVYSDEYVEILEGLSEGDKVIKSFKTSSEGGGGRMPPHVKM